jgi:NAD(P)H-hydrate epimerase
LNAGFEATTVLCGRREKVAGDALVNLEILQRLGHPIELLSPNEPDAVKRVRQLADGAEMIVDALFGTGLQGPLREDCRSLIEAINALNVAVLAVDIPSGLDCDTGLPLGTAIRAVCTVTFVAVKKGFDVSPEAARYTGDVYVASIGVQPPMASPA